MPTGSTHRHVLEVEDCTYRRSDDAKVSTNEDIDERAWEGLPQPREHVAAIHGFWAWDLLPLFKPSLQSGSRIRLFIMRI